MRRSCLAAAALVLSLTVVSAAHADPATDALGKCIIQSSTGKDRLVLVEWIYGAMSAHPELHPMSTISPEQKAALDRQMAAMLQRLIFKDCRTESIAAVKQDGEDGLKASFEALGRIAMTDLMADREVSTSMNKFADYLDKKQWSDFVDGTGR